MFLIIIQRPAGLGCVIICHQLIGLLSLAVDLLSVNTGTFLCIFSSWESRNLYLNTHILDIHPNSSYILDMSVLCFAKRTIVGNCTNNSEQVHYMISISICPKLCTKAVNDHVAGVENNLIVDGKISNFLPREAMLSTVFAVVVCLCVCVCVSVTLRYCIKTAKRRITQTTPHDSPMILVF